MRLIIITIWALFSPMVNAGQVQSVASTNDLLLLNPMSIHSNVFVTADRAIWTYYKASAVAEEDGIYKPTYYNGRWFRMLSMINPSITNYFNTIVVTNLYSSNFFSTNITVNNLTVTTNITIGGTNAATINPTDNYVPVRIGTNSFGDSPFYRVGLTNIAIDGQVILGPGDTNVVFRSGKNIEYTNSSLTTVQFGVANGSGNRLSIGTGGGGVPTLQSSTGNLYLGVTGGASLLTFSVGGLFPSTPNAIDFGQIGNPWRNGVLQGTLYVEGMDSGTNYSRLAISHTGSGGNTVFNSQAGGTGVVASVVFTNQPTVIIAGTTNFLTFGSTNTAPVSAAAPTRWISVQVSGEATAYRIPLYE